MECINCILIVTESEGNPLPLQSPNSALSIVFGISFFITLLIVAGIIVVGIIWLVRRKAQETKKAQNGSESINFSSLQETDENSYQKVDINQENASLPGNEESCIVSNL